jgi:BirA family transcriptional regulator, biotin operon repressor / biotin---[acetyl-CoA-carboxylase] ligase
LQSRLRGSRFGGSAQVLDRCVSTNDEIARAAAQGAPEGHLVLAREQTSGRGRRGRTWFSPAAANLYFSLLLRPDRPPETLPALTLIAGASLAEALDKHGVAARLKWPNDVLLTTPHGLRKVAGILLELSCQGTRVRHVVLGVGVNVQGRDFPEELAARATSLRLATGKDVDALALLVDFLGAFATDYDEFLQVGAAPGLARWRRWGLLGQVCEVVQGERNLEGVAEDVGTDGALWLRQASGERVSIHAGEVIWRSPL